MESNLYIDEEDLSSPTLQRLPGGEISYQGKPMTSMNTALPYPYCTVRPELRHLLGYTPAVERDQHSRNHDIAEVKLFPNPKQRELILKQNWDEAIDSISDDEDATYVPVVSKISPSQRVSNYLEEITTPELEAIQSETRKLREDLQASLKKLQSEPKLPAAKLYTTYDFNKIYKEPKSLEPKSANEYYGFDDDEEHFNIRRRPTVRSTALAAPRRSYLYQPTSVAGGLGQQHFNPYEYLAETSKIDPVAKVAAELDPRSRYEDYGGDDDYKPLLKPKSVLDTLYLSVLDDDYRPRSSRGRSMTSTALAAKNFIDYEPLSRAPSVSYRTDDYYRPKYRFDTDASEELKNNIAIKAQYASNRAKANNSLIRDKVNDYLKA